LLGFQKGGGCFVEGDFLKNRFRWKDSIFNIEDQPGHWGLFRWKDSIFSTETALAFMSISDGLKLSMQFLFLLSTLVSLITILFPHSLEPWIVDALEALEFSTTLLSTHEDKSELR